jgi:membrane protease YdiL (CAAX protease family)
MRPPFQDMQREPHIQGRGPLAPLVEITVMAGLLMTYIWWWGGGSREDFILCVVLYLGFGLFAHLQAGESAASIGLRVDTLAPAARDALLAIVAIGLALITFGTLLGSLHFPPPSVWPWAVWYGSIWGGLQQYGLLAIFYRRFSEIFRGRFWPSLLASLFFSLFHIPNPFLMSATFAAGLLSCWLYRRSPNLIVLGIMHGVVSLLISATLPEYVTMGMRVGPGFYRYIPEP